MSTKFKQLYTNKSQSKISKIFDLLFLVVVWVSLVMLLFSFIYTDVKVVGASMQPNINSQWNNLETYKQDMAYINNYRRVDRGDIIVTYLEEDVYIIKRLIALGGDTVRIEQNTETLEIEIFITGNKIVEDYVVYKAGNQTTLNNFNNLKITMPELFNGDELYVPEGYMFYLGDNRGQSADCSATGPQPLEKLVGKVDIVVPYGDNILQDMWNDFIKTLF